MHETRILKVKGFIDSIERKPNGIYVKGWVCPLDRRTPYEMKLLVDGIEMPIASGMDRPDVASVYFKKEKQFGFQTVFPIKASTAIVLIKNENDKWDEVFDLLKTAKPEIIKSSDNLDSIFKTTNEWKTFMCVDNFYDNPDAVREFALNQEFQIHKEYHKGRRTDVVYRPESLRAKFEKIIGRKITSWDKYGVNGCFQYCTAEDAVVYHYDSQNYAAVVYLTPDAPPEAGTTFYRSKKNKLTKLLDNPHAVATGKSFDELHNETFATGFLDSTQFDAVDTVGNVYNRLVIWDALTLHAATKYFGTDLHNSRLFHLFFFDVEK
jgi:hypothetical protein